MQSNLDRHYILAHDPECPDTPEKPKSMLYPCKKFGRSCQCDICGAILGRPDSLQYHLKCVHKGMKNIKKTSRHTSTCEICGNVYSTRSGLSEHILVKHSDNVLPHTCSMCEKSFTRHRKLETHVNRDHLNTKPYRCSFCNKKYFSDFARKHHVNIKICQHGVVKPFKCIQCENTYSDRRNLEKHMTAMHFGGAYRCVCGEVVRWSSSVAKHKRQCKSYQEYVEINGELMDKVCNIIEVQYSEEMHEQSSESECGNQDGTQLAENNVEHDGHN